MTAELKNVITGEPIQWAVDYIQDILETLESTTDNEYAMALLALEREELRGIWQELFQEQEKAKAPVYCGFGQEGARLFVIRQLLCTLPAMQRCTLHNRDIEFAQACRRLLDEYFFLRSFCLPLEQYAPSPDVVNRALGIIANSGLSDRLLLGTHTLHLYCLNYKMSAPAYYLYPSHTIVCGASDLEPYQQVHCLLHEFGHVIYAAKQAGKLLREQGTRKKAAEQFANRFAAELLTPL